MTSQGAKNFRIHAERMRLEAQARLKVALEMQDAGATRDQIADAIGLKPKSVTALLARNGYGAGTPNPITDANPDLKWRTIEEAPDYEISDSGDVRRVSPGGSPIGIAGRLLRTSKTPRGYLRVSLQKHGRPIYRSVHRLVARSFIGEQPSPQHQVAHIDGNPSNNHFTNLYWALPAENAADKKRHGTQRFGDNAHNRRLSSRDILKIRSLYSNGLSQEKIASLYKTSQSHVGRIVRHELWRSV